jgi:hypothetical protein
MSHWILEPTVVRLRDGASVLSLDGSAWDGGGIPPSFPAPDRVELHLRHYPDGSNQYDVVVDVEAERCWLGGAPDRAVPAGRVEQILGPAREEKVEAGAHDLLMRGFCPACQAQLYGTRSVRRRGRVECLVCGRAWNLPQGAKLF